jgi:hypothetical protein
VLDRHRMPHRTEVAPHDWAEAFEQLFLLGLVCELAFNAVDFKRLFRCRTPPERDIEAALAALAVLRQPECPKEISMSKFNPIDKGNALTLHPAKRADALTKLEGFRPLSPSPTVPRELIAKPVLAAPAFPAQLTRRAPAAMAPESTRLPCQSLGTEHLLDPWTAIEEFTTELHCCGKELELMLEDVQDVTEQFEDGARPMVELLFYAICPRCNHSG